MDIFQIQLFWIRSTGTLKACRKRKTKLNLGENKVYKNIVINKTFISWSNDYELASADTHWLSNPIYRSKFRVTDKEI